MAANNYNTANPAENLIEQIDIQLLQYYKKFKKQYNQVFSEYCEANGFDEELVIDELKMEADKSSIPDFDEDFPFETAPKNSTERNQIIMKIVTECAGMKKEDNTEDKKIITKMKKEDNTENDKYSRNKPEPQKEDEKSSETPLKAYDFESEIKEHSDIVDELQKYTHLTQNLLTIHCPTLFATEHQGSDAKDTAYKTIKTIDVRTQRPIMLFFVDSFCRLRMDKYYYQKQDIDRWGISDFFREYKKYLETLVQKADFKLGNKQVSLEKLENGLKSFMKRVLPTMRIKAPLYTICDDLNQYAMYLWGITNYVSIQKLNGIGNEEDIANIYDQSDIVPTTIEKPVHIDFMIIPQCTLSTFGATDDYEDDGDDYDEDDNDNDTNAELRMGFGGKNENNQPMHEIKDLSKYLVQCGYKKGRDFFVEELDTEAEDFYDHRVIKSKLIGLHHKARVGSYGRLIFIIDRRNPAFVKDSSKKPAYSLDDKQWCDKIYCIKPKQANKMCNEFGYLPEQLVHMSQELILPTKAAQNIGIKSDLNGYMFALSYHIYSSKIVRAYFGFGGQMQRFCIKDICHYWPELFIKKDDAPQKLDNELENFARKAKYGDTEFDKFNDFLT